MGKRPFYRKVRRTLYETVSDSGNSVLRYRGHDDKEYYVASSNDPNVGPGGGMIEVTWQELKNKRDAGELIPGCLYRITDYQCTTTQENTKSAGHQFDIVLLALSANKLAEEGWAMEHPTDVYDVTFKDGVTLKCYLYENSDGNVNIVRTSDLLGFDSGEAFEDWEQSSLIDYNNKTLTFNTAASNEVDWVTNLQYNYFQNSNLSAWKVWYSLDNDKDRFSWADGRIYIAIHSDNEDYAWANGIKMMRYEDGDGDWKGAGSAYAWIEPDELGAYFTNNENPQHGDILYYGDGTETEYIVDKLGINGTGVIYRLIDEWNNDVPYDFKNILYLRQLTDGEIDAQGSDTYIPTFCLYDISHNEYKDASIFSINYKDDEGNARPCVNNFIGSIIANIYSINEGTYALPLTVFLTKVDNNNTRYGVYNNTVYTAFNCSITDDTFNTIILYSDNRTYNGFDGTIILGNSRVVWESMS